jgi:hypothetical protein
LHELTADDLSRFSWKALTTWGAVDDLKHFLPRILELIAGDDRVILESEVFFGKLRMANWPGWPERERKALENYFDVIWNACLADVDGSVWLDELLCGLGRAVEDVRPFLTTWENSRAATSYNHLYVFIEDNLGTLLKRKRFSNAFWSDVDQQMRQVIRWLQAPKLNAGSRRFLMRIHMDLLQMSWLGQ